MIFLFGVNLTGFRIISGIRNVYKLDVLVIMLVINSLNDVFLNDFHQVVSGIAILAIIGGERVLFHLYFFLFLFSVSDLSHHEISYCFVSHAHKQELNDGVNSSL